LSDFAKENVGIGVDIESIKRFESNRLTNSVSFLSRVYSKEELALCFSSPIPAQTLAAKFAGKEATFKALSGLGGKKLAFRDIQIVSESNGLPNVRILNESYCNTNIVISLSHTEDTVIAFVIATRSRLNHQNSPVS
jgi:phosphopantetheine--protein transferase-like protein